MGQLEPLLNIGIQAAVTGIKTSLSWYQGKRAEDEMKNAQDSIAANQQAIKTSQAAAQTANQKAVVAQQAAAAPIGTTSPTILGISSTTAYVGAGIVGVGAIVTTLILTGKI